MINQKAIKIPIAFNKNMCVLVIFVIPLIVYTWIWQLF